MSLNLSQLMQLAEKAKLLQEEAVEIPQSFLDRLQRSRELLQEVEALKKIDIENLQATPEALDDLEAAYARRQQLGVEIVSHFRTCGITAEKDAWQVTGERGAGRLRQAYKPVAERRRAPNKPFEVRIDELAQSMLRMDIKHKSKGQIPTKGRLSAVQQQAFDAQYAERWSKEDQKWRKAAQKKLEEKRVGGSRAEA